MNLQQSVTSRLRDGITAKFEISSLIMITLEFSSQELLELPRRLTPAGLPTLALAAWIPLGGMLIGVHAAVETASGSTKLVAAGENPDGRTGEISEFATTKTTCRPRDGAKFAVVAQLLNAAIGH